MTIPSSKYGQTDRVPKTFWIDQPLRPVLKRIAKRKVGLSEADVINHALYQLKEVQEELHKDERTHEDDNHNNRGAAQ